MTGLNYLAVVVSAVVVVLLSGAYYTALRGTGAALGAAWAQRGRPPPWLLLVELVKSLVVAIVVAGLVTMLAIAGVAGGLLLAVVLWIAFPVALLLGSVTHENVPWKLAAIHAADWLVKLLAIALIVSLWR